MSGGSQGTTTEVKIPKFLRPFIGQQQRIGTEALARLEPLLGGAGAGDLVAPFDPLEVQGQDFAIDRALGAGGFIPTAEQGLLSTARGDFLFGGDAFDEAVQASIRAARPEILSTFGRAGGTPGGLAAAAIQQAASDAFARQFGVERNRQQAAQLALPSIGLLSSDILTRTGAERRGLAQRQLLAPIQAEQDLLSLALQGFNPSSLFGSEVQGPQRSPFAGALTGGLGGAATGAALGAFVPGLGISALGGAALGGLLGGGSGFLA